jgi:hypothetical protein
MVHMIMVVVVVVIVMMVMVHRFSGLRRSPSRSAGDCGLREGVSAEAEREHGGGCQGLDHGRFSCGCGGTQRVIASHGAICLN